ncbi:hypothetical protein SASPL_132814 [Salvia splendens]|uniref:Histone H4 n=1 Tax=Salvia splendens TaxID=180675 RepID=A0A8X8X3W6_SALSN|nr:hypothetical protein SASPL_132814 [Salvia splendens]
MISVSTARIKIYSRRFLTKSSGSDTHPHHLDRSTGVKRIYEETRTVLKIFLENVIRDAVTYTEHARRKTVAAMDALSTALEARVLQFGEIVRFRNSSLDSNGRVNNSQRGWWCVKCNNSGTFERRILVSL